MAYGVKVLGDIALKRKLDALPAAVANRKLEQALIAGGLIVQNAAKAKAPYRTGNLRRSIHIGGHEDLAADYNGIIEEQGPAVPNPEINGAVVAIYIGTNVIYAKQREYGGTISTKNAPFLVWQDYDGNWHRARSVYQAATPYMRPAIDENIDAVQREVGQALAILIRVAVTNG